MSIVDFILIFIIAFTTALGFFFGLVRVIGALVTIVIGLIMAGIFSTQLGVLLQPYVLKNANFSRFIAFIVIYWFVSFFLSLIIKIVNKIFDLPLLKTMNRLFGGIVALTGTIAVLSLIFYGINTYAWTDTLSELLHRSTLITYLILIGKFVSILIPGL